MRSSSARRAALQSTEFAPFAARPSDPLPRHLDHAVAAVFTVILFGGLLAFMLRGSAAQAGRCRPRPHVNRHAHAGYHATKAVAVAGADLSPSPLSLDRCRRRSSRSTPSITPQIVALDLQQRPATAADLQHADHPDAASSRQPCAEHYSADASQPLHRPQRPRR